MKLVSEPIGSTDYKYWKHSLRDFSDEDLYRGLKAAGDFRGYFTLGEFKGLCAKQEMAPCHKPYEALPRLKASEETRQKYLAQLRGMFNG